LLAREGFVTLHVDYRGHAQSDPSTQFEQSSRLGYTEDVISAVHALRAWDGPVDDDRVALLGRSMGGGVVYNALAVSPGLVDAAVVFAPVSSDMVDNFERWGRPNAPLARRIIEEYGEPADEPEFWAGLSARTYFERVSEPVMIHHGTADDSCPIAWSEETVAALEAEGKDVTYHVYQDEQHAFGPQWPLSMERTVAFLRKNVA
ncbi:MAG TPA: alpha/beta fold hydrolase, partial [Nocardioides sp.]